MASSTHITNKSSDKLRPPGTNRANFLDEHLWIASVLWKSSPWVNEFYKKGCQEKTSASTGVRGLDLQPTVSVPRSLRVLLGTVCPSRGSVPAATMPSESKRLCKRDLSGNHGSIRGSRPIAISDYPRGHSV